MNLKEHNWVYMESGKGKGKEWNDAIILEFQKTYKEHLKYSKVSRTIKEQKDNCFFLGL